MPDFDHREKKLEEAIEHFLLTEGGYIKGAGIAFSKELALEPETLLTFVWNTQPKTWEQYQDIYGKNSNKAFLDRFCKLCDR